MPDLAVDVQNAAPRPFRLELRGVPVGDRWAELADKAEARIGDWLSPFTVPHRMMALAAAGRWEAAERMLGALREAARPGLRPRRLGREAGAAGRGVAGVGGRAAHRRGDLRGRGGGDAAALGAMHRLGGSHAQQDVLEQLFLDAAVRAGAVDDARTLLERVAGRHPVPPERRIGYAEAAWRVAHWTAIALGGDTQGANRRSGKPWTRFRLTTARLKRV